MKIAGLAVGLCILAAASGCAATPQERAGELDRLYALGKATGKKMVAAGQKIGAGACDAQFVALGEDKYQEARDVTFVPEGFFEARKVYFRTGCLGKAEPTGTPATVG